MKMRNLCYREFKLLKEQKGAEIFCEAQVSAFTGEAMF